MLTFESVIVPGENKKSEMLEREGAEVRGREVATKARDKPPRSEFEEGKGVHEGRK